MIKIKTICELLLENNSYIDDKDLIDSYKLRLLGEFFRSAYNKNPVTIEFDLSAHRTLDAPLLDVGSEASFPFFLPFFQCHFCHGSILLPEIIYLFTFGA